MSIGTDRTAMTAAGQATLINAVGLHARPAVKLTQAAKGFLATIEFALSPDGPWTDAKSPVKVMRVKAPKGAVLYFRGEGADAGAAVRAMVDLVNARFHED